MNAPVPPDKRPVSRGCCLLGVLGLLSLILVPCFGLTLVLQRELTWQRGPLEVERVWLINETDMAGLAYSSTRINISTPEGQTCVQTSVTFWLWRGASETVTYCECYALTPAGAYEYAGVCP